MIPKLRGITLLWRYYRIFLRSLETRIVVKLQVLGIFSSLTNILGISSIFPFISVFLTGKNEFLAKYFRPYLGEPPPFLESHLLPLMGLLVVATFVFKGLLVTEYARIMSDAVQGNSADMRLRLNQSYVDALGSTLRRERKSTVLHLNNQLIQLASFNFGSIDLNLRLYTFASIGFLLVFMSVKCTLLASLLVFVILIVILPLYRWTRNTANEYYGTLRALQGYLADFLDGAETIKSLCVTETQLDKLRELNSRVITQNRALSISRTTVQSLPEVVMTVCMVAALLILRPDQSQLVLIGSYAYGLIKLVSAMNSVNERLTSQFELLKAPAELYEHFESFSSPLRASMQRGVPTQLPGQVEDIEFDGVTVRDGEKVLLENVSLRVRRGQNVQLVGKNGSGKSTLMKSLLRLAPYEGTIRINGIDLREIPEDAFYRRSAYLSQNQFLFHGSIMENILVGTDKSDRSGAVALCETLGFDRFIKLKPGGYDAVVSEGALNFSGGEKQAICLARAFLRQADVYVFDEYANHLDSQTLERVSKHICSLEDKIVFLISHQPLPFSNRIIPMENGRIKAT